MHLFYLIKINLSNHDGIFDSNSHRFFIHGAVDRHANMAIKPRLNRDRHAGRQGLVFVAAQGIAFVDGVAN